MIKILYAEDDAMQAKTCIDYLKRAGYKVVHATDGEQALWLYRRETPDQFADGIRRFITGLGKKVLLANNIGLLWEAASAPA